MRHCAHTGGGSLARPTIFSYLDYRAFLREWFDAMKRADPDYSYAQFARDGGCSKSTLANVLSGARTPRSGTLDAFARAMALTPSERNYLGLLVELAGAEDLDARRQVMERILASERYHQVRVAERGDESELFRFIEHWYVPAIRELAALPSFVPEPEWIASVLRPRITVDQARDGLDRLFELDLLRHGPDGSVERREIQFRTDVAAHQVAIQHLYRETLPQLLRRVDRADGEEQHVMAATLILPPELMAEAKARLTATVQQLAALSDAAGVDGERRIYQLAGQLLPVSETVG